MWSVMHAGIQPHPPPVNRITDTCKNITFLQLRLWVVTKLLIRFYRSQISSRPLHIFFKRYSEKYIYRRFLVTLIFCGTKSILSGKLSQVSHLVIWAGIESLNDLCLRFCVIIDDVGHYFLSTQVIYFSLRAWRVSSVCLNLNTYLEIHYFCLNAHSY